MRKTEAQKETNELPTVDIKSSNWKGTLISILVILLLCSIITFAIYIINPDIHNKLTRNLNKEKLRLPDLLANKYSPQPTYNGTWISDTEIAFIDKQGNFVCFNVEQNRSTTIVDASVMKQYEVSRAVLSTDRQYVLLASHIKGIFRHSTLAHYKIFNTSSPWNIITVKPDEASEDSYLQAAQWGPIGSQLVFVYSSTNSSSNLYYMPDGLQRTFRITNDADRCINNGIPDWLYEEEILAVSTAFWLSQDGTQLSYAQFNDTNVKFQEYPWYGDAVDKSSQYLDRVKIKYPKPGDTNPTVKLFVVDLKAVEESRQDASEDDRKFISPPANLTQSDFYLTSVAWVNEKSLIAVWLTRVQNYSSYSLCSPLGNGNDWQCTDNFVYEVPDGWLEINKVYVDPNKGHYYTLLPDNSKFKNVQIAKIDIKTSERIDLTEGKKDVTSIVRIVETKDGKTVIYYMSTREDKPGERHAYSVPVPPRKVFEKSRLYSSAWPEAAQVPSSQRCLTCDTPELKSCLYNRMQLSSQATYFVHECLGPEIPYSILRRTDNDTFSEPWLNNQALEDTLATKLLPTVRTELIDRSDYALIVQMFMPASFNEDQIVKYPLLIQVYGGPGSQNVNENFKMNFGKYLASSKNIIYAYVDGRGSGFQGETMKQYLYHKLGNAEIEDQIYAAKFLRDKYKFINKDAIGIWGWSYGGYATAMVLAKDMDDPVFSCGISVAPVTSWLLYDSAYTERYMGMPKENQKSYFESDIMHLANNFKGKKYLLIHGTADDNVHVQNSLVLIKALNHANVMFQTQIYPDENHALPGVSLHLYGKMETFWNECFQMDYQVEEIGLRRRRIVKQGSV